MKYSAFGEIWDINGSSPTDYESKRCFDFKAKASSSFRSYTGRRKEVEFGLSYYVARWYDASTGHFVQADTIIPQPGDSQAWDRFAYVLNNPLKHIDPSGHIPQIEGDDPITHWANEQANQNATARGYQSSNEKYVKRSKPEYSLINDPTLPRTVEKQMLYSMIDRQIDWDRHPIFSDSISVGWAAGYTVDWGYGTVIDYRDKEFGLYREFCTGGGLTAELDIEYSFSTFDGYDISDIEGASVYSGAGMGVPALSWPGGGVDVGIEKEFEDNNNLGFNIGVGVQEGWPMNAEIRAGVCWTKILWRYEWGQ